MFLFRVTLVTMGLIVILVVICVLIGQVQPLPNRVAMLHLDMCKPPCWLGITPGITTLDEAKQYIAITFPEPNYKVLRQTEAFKNYYTIQNLVTHLSFTVEIDKKIEISASVVGKVGIEPDSLTKQNQSIFNQPMLLSVGELTALWGSPHYVGVFSCTGYLELAYNAVIRDTDILVDPPQGMWIYGSDGRVSWNSAVTRIDLFVGEGPINEIDYFHWQGFISYRGHAYQWPDSIDRCSLN